MTEEPGNPSFRQLIRTRNFGLLWGAGGLSAIADQFDLIAFPWLVLLVTGDPLAVGIVISVMAVALLVSSLMLLILRIESSGADSEGTDAAESSVLSPPPATAKFLW